MSATTNGIKCNTIPGVCKEGLLREIIDAYDDDENEGRAPVRAASEDLLEEIARRWVIDNRSQ